MRTTKKLAKEMKKDFDKCIDRLQLKDKDVLMLFSVFSCGYRSGYNKHREMVTKVVGGPILLERSRRARR